MGSTPSMRMPRCIHPPPTWPMCGKSECGVLGDLIPRVFLADIAFQEDVLTCRSMQPQAAAKLHKRLPNYEAIRAESPDIFDFMPATLERKFKNPCWYKVGVSGVLGRRRFALNKCGSFRQHVFDFGRAGMGSKNDQARAFISKIAF
eukprot:1158433-Pelagomonas_calceolata.AAC.23